MEDEGDPRGALKPQLTVVPAAEDMDDMTFAKHMTLRHRQSLGGLSSLSVKPNVIPAWRSFHRHLHRLAVPGQFDHIHKPLAA